MEKRIALEKRGLPDDQITELILDNCRSTNIEGLTENFTSLKILSLINVGLVTLKNFPKLPSLCKLELSDNRISNGLNHLTNCPKLKYLNLSGNKIKEYKDVEPLKELTNLVVLDLFNNEVTGLASYREEIFKMIPSLKYLDGFDKEEGEAISDEEDEANASYTDSDLETDYTDDEEGTDEYPDDDDNISLAEVYNDDLEEDNSSWNEADAVEDEQDFVDELSDEDDESADDGEAPAPEKPASEGDGKAEEPESRGTKRKLEGNDG